MFSRGSSPVPPAPWDVQPPSPPLTKSNTKFSRGYFSESKRHIIFVKDDEVELRLSPRSDFYSKKKGDLFDAPSIDTATTAAWSFDRSDIPEESERDDDDICTTGGVTRESSSSSLDLPELSDEEKDEKEPHLAEETREFKNKFHPTELSVSVPFLAHLKLVELHGMVREQEQLSHDYPLILEQALNCMSNHVEFEEIQALGCQVLLLVLVSKTSPMCPDSKRQFQHQQPNTQVALRTAIEAHPTNTDVQYFGCLAQSAQKKFQMRA
uniref:Uncharacterized protein n=1 Tax=Grammatophora oceanica TaxID=210454 RepID=A0A7S1YF50_9STRA|mmetsp:Transcript_43746/g.64935  ORF Transcript_43746/g.64935 Transcript_43746/m.64935 type:complete len:267 (+) Transcript_43746:72-872(+)